MKISVFRDPRYKKPQQFLLHIASTLQVFSCPLSVPQKASTRAAPRARSKRARAAPRSYEPESITIEDDDDDDDDDDEPSYVSSQASRKFGKRRSS